MRAIVRDTYGPPDVLRAAEVERPEPGPGQVSIRVRASSINAADHYALSGRPYPARLFFGLRRPRHRVPGMDVAGEVAAVGPGVTRFGPGDAVFGELEHGAWAEFACAPVERLALKPEGVSFEQAAAAAMAGVTALQGLRDVAGVRSGQSVLVNGASGGVGTFAVQVARALGAEVTAVCSAANVEQARALGAAHVVDYGRADFTEAGARYDVIFDLAGSASLRRCRALLRPGGCFVSSSGRIGRVLAAGLASLMPGSPVRLLSARTSPDDLAALGELMARGSVTSAVERRVPLDGVAEALARQLVDHPRGKAVITL